MPCNISTSSLELSVMRGCWWNCTERREPRDDVDENEALRSAGVKSSRSMFSNPVRVSLKGTDTKRVNWQLTKNAWSDRLSLSQVKISFFALHKTLSFDGFPIKERVVWALSNFLGMSVIFITLQGPLLLRMECYDQYPTQQIWILSSLFQYLG